MRIVSLLPGNTEMVCALGLSDQLVGISHECDYPAEIKHLPVVTASRIDSHQSQADIHAQVTSLGQSGRGMYTLNESLLAELRPDLILTQAKCEVCAVDYDDVVSTVHRLWPTGPVQTGCGTGVSPVMHRRDADATPVVLSFQPNSIWDMLADMNTIARAASVEQAGAKVVNDLRERIVAVQARAADAPVSRRSGVVFLEWLDPLMTCGGWQPEMIELAGGKCLISVKGQKAAWTTEEAIAAVQPDMLILAPCGVTIAQGADTIAALRAQDWFRTLPAVRESRVYVADGNAYFNRPGPRLVDSLEMLGDMIGGTIIDGWRQDQVQGIG